MQEIAQQLDRWFAALKSGDPDKVTRLYSRDAILLSTLQGDVKIGHRQIRQYFAKSFLPKRPIGVAVEPHTRVLGGVAVNSGIYRFSLDGGHTAVARYTFVYQWAGSEWLIVEHHSSVSPTPAAPTDGAKKKAPAKARSGK